jgi:hypothetical protein
MRTYRAAPRVAAALFPALPPSRSLLGRVHDLLNGLGSRLNGLGGSADPATQVAAAGGTRGAGMVVLAKLLTVCAGAAGGAAVCVASGVLPAPLEIASDHSRAARIERISARPADDGEAVQYQPAGEPAPQPQPPPRHPPAKQPSEDAATEAASTGAVEYEAAPAAPVSTPSESGTESAAPSGSAAGEFGP